jgi:hypothetical protein
MTLSLFDLQADLYGLIEVQHVDYYWLALWLETLRFL